MSDFKFPVGDPVSTLPLNTNRDIFFPEERMDDGFNRTFEVLITGATGLDTNVKFAVFSGLDVDVLDAINITESAESMDLTGLTGKLVFHRSIINTLDTAFKISVTGTNAGSTATFLIRARSE